MSSEGPIFPITDAQVVARMRAEIEKSESTGFKQVIEKLVLAALSSIPWVGVLVGVAGSIRSDSESSSQSYLWKLWVEEHRRKLMELGETFHEIQSRFDNFGSGIDERIQSDEYLAIVRKAFRAWDQADAQEKRRMLANIVINAGTTRLCSDDVIRLFLDWIEIYNEVYFAVIREIFRNPGSTRFGIWSEIYGEIPREDSAEADLYKLLIRDLSTGGVVRQARETDALGRFVRKTSPKRRGKAPTVLESAFEDEKAYLLTSLGQQFVHYAMNESVTRLSGENRV